LAALAGDRNLLVPLFSPKSAALAAAALAGAMAPLVLLCLSPAVEQSLGVQVAHPRAVARRPDADGMLEIIARALNSGALP
jgi:uroporphyrinogen-III synthase